VTVTVIVLTPEPFAYECDVVLLVVALAVPSPQFQSNLAAIAVAGVTVATTGLYVVVVGSLFAVSFVAVTDTPIG